MRIKAVNFYLYNHEFKNPIVTPKVQMTHRKALIVEFLVMMINLITVNVMRLNQIGMPQRRLIQLKKHFLNGRKASYISHFMCMKIGNHI